MGSDFEKVERILAKYPSVKFCFEKYVRWIFSKSGVNIRNFVLIDMLLQNSDCLERMQQLEDRLTRARQILNLSEEGFRTKFGFQNDLLTDDKEKIHDILAEPLFVLDLHNNNFKNIEKLPANLKKDDEKLKLADFRADYKSEWFAIELKVTRTESWVKDGEPLGDAAETSCWKNMLYNNCITKIEDKKRRVFEQLDNTCKYFNCAKKIIVFYTRRLGPSTFTDSLDYKDVAQSIIKTYPQIHYVGFKDYFANTILFYPDLGTV